MPKRLAPHEFGSAGQIDPRRWNENVRALEQREQELLDRRWARFELTFPFEDFTNATSGYSHEARFKFPFACEIEAVHFKVSPADTETYSVEVGNPYDFSLVGLGSNKVVETVVSRSYQLPANTEVEVLLTVEGSPGTYDAGEAQVTVYFKVDVMRDITAFSTLSLLDLSSSDVFPAATANAVFTTHAANMALLTADSSLSVAIHSESPQYVGLQLAGIAIPTRAEYHKLPTISEGWYLDTVECWFEGTGTVRFGLYQNATEEAGVDIVGTGVGNQVNGSITSIDQKDTDGTDWQFRISGGTTVYRAHAVLHFRTRG